MSYNERIPWDLVAELRSAPRRRRVVERLAGDPASASELAEEMNLETDSVSKHFRRLRRTDPPLVECLTPNRPHYRIHGLTEAGEKINDIA